ncbi:MAG TPA: lytic transglycosylase domain-containing protein [Clostridia bacterium]
MYIILFLAAVFFGLAAANFYVAFSYPLKYQDYVGKYSNEFGVDKAMIYSIMRAESSFDPKAVSRSGAIGLMQLMPSTALMLAYELGIQDFTTEMLFDPEINIRLGTCYYGKMLKKFENYETALAAYNAGEGNVSSWLSNPEYSKDGKTLDYIPFKETSNYIKKINKNYKIYKIRIK